MLHKSILEQTCVRYRLSGLQDLSLVRVTTSLCNNRQMLDLIMKCNFQTDLAFRLHARNGKEWEAVQDKANELISQLCTPVILEKMILELLWPTCYRIMLWHSIYAPSISNSCLQRFYWTEGGRIDNARTVRYIISNKSIPLRERFVLGCSVCLSEELREMWREMSAEDKEYFHSANNHKISPLFQLWAYILGEGAPNHFEFNRLRHRALECVIQNGLLEAFKYLFSMSNLKKSSANWAIVYLLEKMDEGYFIEEDEYDIGYFAFSEMSDIFQETQFRFTILVFSLLLHSYEYKLCLTLLKERLDSLQQNEVLCILRLIFYTYHLEVVNHDDCRELFVDFWRMIPSSMKNSIRYSEIAVQFLCVLIKDTFPFILEKGALEKRPVFTSSQLKQKWEFLTFIIKEEVVTFPFMERYRTEVLSILKIKEYHKTSWNRVLRFVRDVANKNH